MKTTTSLILLTLFFLQAYLVRFSIGSYPTNLLEILIGVSAIAFLITIITKKRFIKTIKAILNHWIITTLILLTVISLLTTEIFNYLDFIRHSKFLFFGLIFGFIFLETFKTPAQRIKAFRVAGYGAITFGIFSLIYNLLGHNVAYDLRLLGPLDAAVYLAYYLAPFLIFFTIQATKTRKNLDIAAAIVLGLLVIATRSMGAIGASFAIILYYLFRQSNLAILKQRITKIALAVAAIIVVVAIFYTKILPTIQTEYSSLDERGQIWKTTTHLLSDPGNLIWGLGFGQFQYHYENSVVEVLGQEPLDYIVLQPHNIFLLFMSQYGLLGLLVIFVIFHRTLTRNKTVFSYMLIYFLLHGLIDTPIFKNDLLIIFVILLEIVLERPSLAARDDIA
jgi:O-antigen ligase/polysaccharide polymerase Wzy-like membrane protein